MSRAADVAEHAIHRAAHVAESVEAVGQTLVARDLLLVLGQEGPRSRHELWYLARTQFIRCAAHGITPIISHKTTMCSLDVSTSLMSIPLEHTTLTSDVNSESDLCSNVATLCFD